MFFRRFRLSAGHLKKVLPGFSTAQDSTSSLIAVGLLSLCGIVEHFGKRLEAMDGKAMIVCMSRRICVELYRVLVCLRSAWRHQNDDKDAIKKGAGCIIARGVGEREIPGGSVRKGTPGSCPLRWQGFKR